MAQYNSDTDIIDGLRNVVKRQLDDAVRDIIDSEIASAQVRIAERVREAAAKIAIDTNGYAVFDRMGSDLRILIKADLGDKK